MGKAKRTEFNPDAEAQKIADTIADAVGEPIVITDAKPVGFTEMEEPQTIEIVIPTEYLDIVFPFSKDGGRTVDSTAIAAAGMRIEYGRGAGFNEFGYRIVPR